jgi:polyvinyl alcohol dehydrogenase (cytochrome)
MSAADSSLTQYLEWPMFGQNFGNTATGLTTIISPTNVSRLKPKWTFTTAGDVSARAAVVGGGVYFPDWGGYFYRLNAQNGHSVWSKNIASDYFHGTNGATVVSRTSPAVDGNTVFIGTQSGAWLLAINTSDGSLRWKTLLDPHPLALDTSSPVVINDVVYVGVASLEEGAAISNDYPCCTSRGSVVALNAKTGAVIWKTPTTSAGYSGVGVWGSTVVPDLVRGVVYATTGNNYSIPTDPAYTTCVSSGGAPAACQSSSNHVDSVLALSMKDGSIRWSQRLATTDDWNVACFFGGINCPVQNQGPDFDFASGANVLVAKGLLGLPRLILGAGQKSGAYSAFDPDNGHLLWSTQVGPGSSLGGMEWGSATDGARVYVAIANLYGIPYTVGGQLITGGSWAALDPTTGKILWQKAEPAGSLALGPVAVANGVVYAPSMAGGTSQQNMFALDARTGAVLWSFAAGGSVIAGASIVGDTVYWGSGYSHLGIAGQTANNKFYAFSLNGH